MTRPVSEYAVDRLDDDGGPIRPEGTGRDPDGRLVWAPPAPAGRLDGAWWPRTHDAGGELTALMPAVSHHLGGPVRRVSVNIDAWGPDQPRWLQIGGVRVRLGWFRTLDPATVTLGRDNDDRVTLLVIPPELEPGAARRLLRRLSSATQWPDSAATALGSVGPSGDAADDPAPVGGNRG